jgi:exopolyphosphatase/guanosine-5'-triphosphate,3'-diphosphate pyrophosphatase
VRIAALDLGSNSFHLLVVQAHSDGSFDTLVREKKMLRLADMVSREGRISEAAAEEAVSCVRRFRSLAESAGATEIVARATSALREADNSDAVVDRIEAATGVRVEVISGMEEARLIFSAVRASVVLEPPPALCLDLGGGSLELMVGDRARLYWASSVKLGVARLSAELVRHDPLGPGDVGRVRHRVTSALTPLVESVARYRPRMLVGTSGTLCDLARMAAALSGTVPASVNQLRVSRRDLAVVNDHLLELPASERPRLAGLEAKRADIVPAGSLLLLTAMELFGFDELTVGDWALREGIVIDAIGHHEPWDWSHDPRAIRRASVLGLARRCDADEAHGRHVARLGASLFDQTVALHGLSADDRELLEYGCLLHDIGEHVSVDDHHKHSAYLIEHGRLRGFTPDEVALLACLGRFHRRGKPKSSFEPYASLDGEARDRLARLLAILRVADGLDHGHTGSVERVEIRSADGVTRLLAHSGTDIEVELWGGRRGRALFEGTFGTRLEILATTPDVEAVAS